MDKVRRLTDEKLKHIEDHITDIYTEARAEISEKWDKYMANADKRLEKLQKEYDNAVLSGDNKEIATAKKKLDKAKYNVTFANERYNQMVEETTFRLANTNQLALMYANGQMPEIYAINHNFYADTAKQYAVSFNLVDEHTLARAVRNEIPWKRISVPRDMRWNTKFINSQVTQGIIQGESMDKISKRIFPEIMKKSKTKGLTEEELGELIKRNKQSATRAARTMVTAVENLGRLDGMKELEKEGIIQKKIWMATADDRTRPSHIDIDGEEQKLDDMFSNGCMYPGDSRGPAEEVWMCRCSMGTRIVGIRKKDGHIKKVDYGGETKSHHNAIEREKDRRGK